MVRRIAQIAFFSLVAASAAAADDAPDARLTRLNEAFLEHLGTLGPEHVAAVELVAESWPEYRRTLPESFVPEALASLYPAYRDGLRAYDERRYPAAAELLAPLRAHADPYLAATARYFHARALAAQGLLEEAEAGLQDVIDPTSDLASYTPYAAHLVFLRAHCEAGNLRFEQAVETLGTLLANSPDAVEPVQVGARQLLLEIERRERGTLAEVAAVMGYAVTRLQAADTSERLGRRQEQIVALLDGLIEDAQQREQQSGPAQRSAQQRERPRTGAQESRLPEPGTGRVGDLHQAPQASPAEAWGQLPPAERERILQSLRDRFPSRYRELVEQYYRTLAEEQQP